MKNKVFLLFLIVLIPFTIAEVQTQIENPEEDYEYDREQDLTIEWVSINDYDFSRTITESEIILEDEVGREFSEVMEERDETVGSNSDAEEEINISPEELEDFDEGKINIKIADTWQEEEEEDIGEDDEPSHSEELDEQDSEDQTNINLVEEEEECDDEIVVDFVDDRTEGGDDEIHVEWDSTNLYCETNTYQESTIELEDENSETVTRTADDLSGESGGEDFTVRPEYTFEGDEVEELESGEVTVNVESDWDLGSGDESTTVSFESLEDEDDGVSGDASVNIDSPNEGSTESIDEDLTIDWVSESNFDDVVELQEGEVELEDPAGRTTETTLTINEDIGVDETRENSVTFDSGDYSVFDEGEWTLTVEDTWAEETVEEQLTFNMEDTGTEDDEEDLVASVSSDLSTADVGDEFEFDGSGSTGEVESFEWSFDDGNTATGETVTHSFEEEGTFDVELEITGSSQIDTDTVTVDVEEGAEAEETSEDETTDEETEEDTAGQEEPRETIEDSDEDTETDDADGETDECPDGFAYDEEDDVCIEAEDVDDGSGEGDEVSDSVSDGVEQEGGGVLGSLDVGPDAGGVPVWMVLGVLLVVGVLFRRSDYELDL